jgi:anaerobic ribonucleoside-triphosphate reductase activating protein
LKLIPANKPVKMHSLRIHHIEPTSSANGPGVRFVVWVQGCSLGCPACFNPETHAKTAGIDIAVDDLCRQILARSANIEGVTISGGEPLQQIDALAELLRAVKSGSSLSTLVFSGFGWSEIQRIPGSKELLPWIDVLLAGRYQANLRLARGLIGSANKTTHFLNGRYSLQDLELVPEAEVLINPDGSVALTGIDPLVRKA